MNREIRIPFGKHEGRSLAEVALIDPSYLHWMADLTDEGSTACEFANCYLDAIADALYNAQPEEAREVNLTPHQFEAVSKLDRAIKDGEPIVLLEGGAGYGKSYATSGLVKCLRENGFYIRGMAVSYVASQVLAARLNPFGIPARTVASTLRYQKTLDLWTGEDVYEPGPETDARAGKFLSEGNALIVDECSMIPDDTVDLLSECAVNGGGALIFVGDSHQLPPVHQETRSFSCDDALAEGHVATLTQPMRYGRDSHLYAVEQTMRNSPMNVISGIRVAGRTSNEVIMTGGVGKMLDKYVENHKANPNALHRALFYQRKLVNGANNAIRLRLYGPSAPLVVDDERLMVLATTDYPYLSRQDAETGRDLSERFYSGQNFRVTDAKQVMYRIDIAGETFGIPCWQVVFAGRSNPIRIIFSITETMTDKSKLGGAEYEQALSACYAYGRRQDLDSHEYKIRWRFLKQLQNDFLRVAYQYATTVHRAQGQTVDFAYVQPRPLLAIPGITGKALAYVAMTRARTQLVVS